MIEAFVSPAYSNRKETLNTLKYANRARNIQNKAVVSILSTYFIRSKFPVYSWLSFLSSLCVTFNVLRCRAFTVILYFFFYNMPGSTKKNKKKLLCLQKDRIENDSEIRDLKEKVVKLEKEKANCIYKF